MRVCHVRNDDASICPTVDHWRVPAVYPAYFSESSLNGCETPFQSSDVCENAKAQARNQMWEELWEAAAGGKKQKMYRRFRRFNLVSLLSTPYRRGKSCGRSG